MSKTTKKEQQIKIQFDCSKKSNDFLTEFRKVSVFKGITKKTDQVNLALEMFSDLLDSGKIQISDLIKTEV